MIGIDPGKTGGIVILITSGLDIYRIPKIKTEVDLQALKNIFIKIKSSSKECDNFHLYIEKVHAIFGSSAKSTFEFGRICGQLEGFIVANEIPHTYVQPKVWQKEMFEGIKEIRKPGKLDKNGKLKKGKIDTKAMAELALKRLLPSNYEQFYVVDASGNKSKNVHDGLVDAYLIAEYGRRKQGIK